MSCVTYILAAQQSIFKLVRAECVRCPWLLAETMATIFGILLFFFFLGVPLFKTPEGVVVGVPKFCMGS